MTIIRSIGVFIDRKIGGKVFAKEIVESAYDGAPQTREIVTLSTDLNCGDQNCGQAGLWTPKDFQMRFSLA